MNYFFALSLFVLSFSASAAKRPIKEGPWRFEMKATYAVIPFVIEFKYRGEKLIGTLLNGKEKIPLRNIDIKKDLILVPLQHYENGLELTVQNDSTVKGDFVRYNKNPEVRNPVFGKVGKDSARYTGNFEKPKAHFDGQWAVTLKEEDGKESKGIVLINQDGSRFTGTIMSPTGDYRYMEGYLNGELFEGASFDGVYNYVFKGRVEKHTMEAAIEANWLTKVTGNKDANAKMPDPYKETKLDKMAFKFGDIDGRKVTLEDPKFKDRAVIVTFFGSWCPNCIDETKYLIPWYHKNHMRGVEIVALAFERDLDEMHARMQLTKTVKKFKIPYTVLLAGSTTEDKPMDKIPTLKNFISFPTTVFLNKKHEVVKVHAGFNGPATGKFFEEWKVEFEKDVEGLLK
ncbi:MAG: TlpA disulfide reductase family protein [Bacteriovoracaceae bacterium]